MTSNYKSVLLALVYILLFSLVILGLLLGIHFFEDVPIKYLTNDVAVVGDLSVYAGLLSQIGILLWFSGAAICFYTLQFIRSDLHRDFLKASIFFTIFLGLDDAFMFHEIVFPSLGIHQVIIVLSYGLLMLLYLLKFYKLLLKTDYIIFVFALGCFAVSLFIDNFMYDFSPYISKLIEDIAKLIGILGWSVFFGRICLQFQKEGV